MLSIVWCGGGGVVCLFVSFVVLVLLFSPHF